MPYTASGKKRPVGARVVNNLDESNVGRLLD